MSVCKREGLCVSVCLCVRVCQSLFKDAISSHVLMLPLDGHFMLIQMISVAI